MTTTKQERSGEGEQDGVALVAALLLLLLITAMAVSLMYTVNTEQHLQHSDSANSLAYYAAESAMEKMTSDLSVLYSGNSAPSAAQVAALGNSAHQPVLPGVAFPEYSLTLTSAATQGLLTSGPNAGLMANWQNVQLSVTAVRPSGEQARLQQTVQVALIPIFQFGAFSQSDLSYFPGGDLDFTGRVQTNGNLFLSSGGTLTFHQQIRAAADVIRDQLSNGVLVSSTGQTGQVKVPQTSGGCDVVPPATNPPACRPLALSPPEESAFGGPTPQNGGTGHSNALWQAIAQQTYNSMILSGDTGAQTLPFSNTDSASPDPIQMIRRPLPADTSEVGAGRLYNQAQIRVLLSDNPADLPGGTNDPGNIRLANYSNPNGIDYSNGVPVGGAPNCSGHHNCTYFAEASVGQDVGWVAPPASDLQNGHFPPEAPFMPPPSSNWNLIDGWLRVEIVRADGSVVPVTQEWIELGFARDVSPPMAPGANDVNQNAILLLQQLSPSGNPNPEFKWYPINLYDVREGEFREGNPATCRIGGVMNLVEIDVGNLQRWLQGTIGASGTQVDFRRQNGYVLYFSDRRGMLPNVDAAQTLKTGEYGFEDVINPNDSQGAPNNLLDTGEDVNGDKLLEKYGGENLGLGFNIAQPQTPNTAYQEPNTLVDCVTIARRNWVSGARHAVRLIDAGLGNLPFRPDNNAGGFTLASENPVYILGNYNSNGAFANGDGHVASAVIADAVTLLSSSWQDLRSFSIRRATNGRTASSTSYRLAIAGGKNMDFPSAGVAGNLGSDFGTDGGAHNFLRYLEDWSGQTVNYRGSMVSPFYSQYATGVFKCCNMVYGPPGTRNYSFDSDFQNITKMPPGTPNLRSIISLGFQQVFY